ncbi:hydroxymethylglutaryl-CoA reductase, degradative [Streptomyces sp. IBSNAI002]|uniref:hydroxymethylglutaryl-CoA reductase, degradative n=1 Tax=Streptomyces sp. IBSNAI002 TaxID=3457500 RepID=UPI003FCF7529
MSDQASRRTQKTAVPSYETEGAGRPPEYRNQAAGLAKRTTSRHPGFHRSSLRDRLNWLVATAGLDSSERDLLESGAPLPITQADLMIENTVSVYGLPYGIALNFTINGHDRIVPMVIEEPAVVAAACHAARLVRACGGITADADPALMPGQIHIVDLLDAQAAATRVSQAADRLVAEARRLQPRMVSRGFGTRKITAQALPDGTLLVTFIVDVGDAMGANSVNTLLETVTPEVVAVTGGVPGVRILSNLADSRIARARVSLPDHLLKNPVHDGPDTARRIAQASALATMNPHRAATHNKGIMNGIDAVAVATGQDWRAIEAGVHSYAARTGTYQPVATWNYSNGLLHGFFEAPLVVGTVGERIRANPLASLSLKLLETVRARELATVMAAVGLAQNLAALHALTGEGIQRGHMALHQRSLPRPPALSQPSADPSTLPPENYDTT